MRADAVAGAGADLMAGLAGLEQRLAFGGVGLGNSGTAGETGGDQYRSNYRRALLPFQRRSSRLPSA